VYIKVEELILDKSLDIKDLEPVAVKRRPILLSNVSPL
jgi:hypothetical protein